MALQRFQEHNSIGNIDRESGIIYGVAVITGDREALGHEMYVDQTMIEQVHEHGLAAGDVGVKARFDHPNPCAGSMGTELGRFKNFSIDGNKVRADLHLNDASAKSPNGDYREYVLSLAEEDPDQFATSIVFRLDEPEVVEAPDGEDDNHPQYAFPHARVKSLTHVDVVGEGAANDGLFSDGVEMEYMNLKAKQFIKGNLDLFKPLLDELFKEYQDKNSQTHTEMKEDKSWFDKFFGSKSKDEAEQVAQEVDSKFEEASNEITELSAKVEELSAEIESQKESFEATKQELSAKNEGLVAELAAVTSERDSLSAKINSTIEIEEGDDKAPDAEIEEEAQLTDGQKIVKGLFSEFSSTDKKIAEKNATKK